MKKWLFLFIVLNFVFVGLVLKLSINNERNIASYNTDTFYDNLTDGQKNKYDFVKSFHFSIDSENLTWTSDRLQALCQTKSMIELKFKAVSVAYGGTHPSISHIYSCENIRKDLSITSLSTSIKDFFALHKTSSLKLSDSEMKSSQVYPGEEFPQDWILSDVIITGELNFTVSSVELNKVHTDHRFEFTLATSAK